MSKLLILALCVVEVVLQLLPCENNMNCRDCITDNDICVWCAADGHKQNITRCVLKDKATENWCAKSFQQRPKPSIEVISSTKDAHINPQKYKLKILPGESFNINFTLSDFNYPVDVYFVVQGYFDGHRDQIQYQINNFMGALQKTTKDISLGFGTFIHKNMNNVPKICNSFVHRLNFTSDYSVFQQMVKSYPERLYCGSPHGGFDALAQAIACKHFGWRDGSKKIIVYLSGSRFYTVGENSESKSLKSYDGKCHTDADGIYTAEREMDYPSLDMINRLATENDVTVLFTYYQWHDVRDFYINKGVQQIHGAEVFKIDDSINMDFVNKVNKLITSDYTIKSRIQYKGDAEQHFKIIFNADCSKDTDACIVFKDRVYNYTASITLLRYEGLDNYDIDIEVAFPGVTDKLKLDIEVITQCECGSKTGNSTHCGGDTPQNEISKSTEKPKYIENGNTKGMSTCRYNFNNKKEVNPNSIPCTNIIRNSILKNHKFWKRLITYEVYEEMSDDQPAERDRPLMGQESITKRCMTNRCMIKN